MLNAVLAERDTFIASNVGLVHSCARRFKGRGIEYDDLYQAGCLGLVKAYDAFDNGRGVRFSTYAVPVILGEIKKLFRDGGSIKVSRQLKELSLKISRENENYVLKNGTEPAISELSEIMGISEDLITEAIGCSKAPLSLTASEDDESKSVDIPVECNEDNITELLTLNTALLKLPEQDRQIVQLRFVENKTQADTASIIGTTQVQVSRRERRLLIELRKLMCE